MVMPFALARSNTPLVAGSLVADTRLSRSRQRPRAACRRRRPAARARGRASRGVALPARGT